SSRIACFGRSTRTTATKSKTLWSGRSGFGGSSSVRSGGGDEPVMIDRDGKRERCAVRWRADVDARSGRLDPGAGAGHRRHRAPGRLARGRASRKLLFENASFPRGAATFGLGAFSRPTPPLRWAAMWCRSGLTILLSGLLAALAAGGCSPRSDSVTGDAPGVARGEDVGPTSTFSIV